MSMFPKPGPSMVFRPTLPRGTSRPGGRLRGRGPALHNRYMREVNVGIVGLGYVGTGTLAILAENASQIALKLGFPLRVAAVCSRTVHAKEIAAALGNVFRTTDWRELVDDPEVDIVAELVGGTHAARELLEAAIDRKKSVVT